MFAQFVKKIDDLPKGMWAGRQSGVVIRKVEEDEEGASSKNIYLTVSVP